MHPCWIRREHDTLSVTDSSQWQDGDRDNLAWTGPDGLVKIAHISRC